MHTLGSRGFLLGAVTAVLALLAAGCTSGGGGGASTATPTPTPTASLTPTPTPTVSLTLNVVGPGSVASSPAGIACPGTCAGSFVVGTSVTLSATAATGAGFLQWFDVPCSTTSCALVLQTNAAADVLFHCDPVAATDGCANGEGCYLATYRNVQTALCSTAGAGTQGATCATDADCARGFSCIDTGTKACRAYCQFPAATCPAATSCNHFTSPVIVGGVEYGACL